MDYVSLRFFFETKEAAIVALLRILSDARITDKDYSFGSLSADQILASGLLVYGDAQHLIAEIREIPGTSFYYD